MVRTMYILSINEVLDFYRDNKLHQNMAKVGHHMFGESLRYINNVVFHNMDLDIDNPSSEEIIERNIYLLFKYMES